MGRRAKNKQQAPEPIEKPVHTGLSRRAQAKVNKQKTANEKKRQNTEDIAPKSNKKAKAAPKAMAKGEDELWDDLEVASDDNSEAELDEFDMDEDEEQSEEEDEEVEQEFFPKSNADFLGSDSEQEVDEDDEEDEDDDEYDDDELVEVHTHTHTHLISIRQILI